MIIGPVRTYWAAIEGVPNTTLYDDGYCNSQRPVREFVFPTNAKLEI